jgi:4-oxalocrotonate tautomerase
MPFVEVTMTAGRTDDQIRGMLAAVHDAMEASLGVPTQSIRVVLREVPNEHWQAGRVTMAEKKAAEAPDSTPT